jgi:hypothetical protein
MTNLCKMKSGIVRAMFGLFLATACLAGTQESGTDFIWLEGESASTSFPANVAGWGKPQFLSEGKWLHISVEEGDVEKKVPNDGIVLQYDFTLSQSGSYEIWNRIGFEFARSPFAWRIDKGDWQTISPEALTTDLMDLDFWCEVAWLKMGTSELSGGKHQLDIRLSKAKDDSGKWQRLLYASDALCLYRGSFLPNAKFKPGQSYRDGRDEEAAAHVFRLASCAPGQRSFIELKGLWEIARDDEQMPGPVAEPMRELLKQAFWRGISVPGDKNTLREDLLFAHRLWYRTRVEVPASMSGRSFYLDFPCNNLNTTVYVKRPLVGIDNIYLKVQRSTEWKATVRPLLNIGGLVEYKKGNGRVVLCNLKFQKSEAVPVNQTKKRTILATVLRNLKAPFSDAKTVIAGANLRYSPIDIHTKATTYKDERGWFGDKSFTFKSLPPGEHAFADVPYLIYEMPTSPVPQVLMLGGNGVPGNLPEQITDIPINTKADALFFLHTARIDRPRDQREQNENARFELCRYVIHYADGQTAEVPVYSEIDIDQDQNRSHAFPMP